MDDDRQASEARANDGAGGDSGVPPGWDYNPATWGQRLPIVVLAVVGGAIAFYLTLFQWNAVSDVWEPFFSGGPDHASGSAKILKSPTSTPVSALPWLTDGLLGFLGYVGDAVTGVIGGTRRWRTMPWIVIVFGILVGPLGAVSIGLVITQPLGYDTFSTLALCTAVVSVLMIGPAMDEMLASLQYMKRSWEQGLPFWRTFFGIGMQDRLPETDVDLEKIGPTGLAWAGNLGCWAAAAAGVYVMFAPHLHDYGRPMAAVDRTVGPLVIAFAVISAWEATRKVRWLNVPLGLTLIVAPFVTGAPQVAIVSGVVSGLVIAGLALVPYPPTQTFGGGWSRLFHDRSPNHGAA